MPEPFDREENRSQEIFNSFAAAIVEVCNWIDPVLGEHANTVMFIVRGAVSAVMFVRKVRAGVKKNSEKAKPKRPAARKRPIKDAANSLDRGM